MNKYEVITAIFVFALTIGSSNQVFAAGSSTDDPFAALAESKAGTGATHKSSGDVFDSLANSRSQASPSSGHGIEAGIAEINTFRAEQKAQAEKIARQRFVDEAAQEDKKMASECTQILEENGCRSTALIYTSCDNKLRTSCSEQRSQQLKGIYEEQAIEERACLTKRSICKSWKAAGPKAKSDSFKAQLSQQDNLLSDAMRIAAEQAKQRDAIIQADENQKANQAERANKADRERAKAESDELAAVQRARDLEKKKEEDAREEKLRISCMAELAKDHHPCACWKWDKKKTSVKGAACEK